MCNSTVQFNREREREKKKEKKKHDPDFRLAVGFLWKSQCAFGALLKDDTANPLCCCCCWWWRRWWWWWASYDYSAALRDTQTETGEKKNNNKKRVVGDAEETMTGKHGIYRRLIAKQNKTKHVWWPWHYRSPSSRGALGSTRTANMDYDRPMLRRHAARRERMHWCSREV